MSDLVDRQGRYRAAGSSRLVGNVLVSLCTAAVLVTCGSVFLADFGAGRPEQPALDPVRAEPVTHPDQGSPPPTTVAVLQGVPESQQPPLVRLTPIDESDSVPAAADRPWPEPLPILNERLELSEGMLTPQFAFCQEMKFDEFVETARQLRFSGYRPTRIRPYFDGRETRVAAIWQRDGRRWLMVGGHQLARIERADLRNSEQGYRPVDIAGWLADCDRYVAIWVQRQDGERAFRLTAGESGDLKALAGNLAADHFRSHTWHCFVGQAGIRQHSGIWVQDERGSASRWFCPPGSFDDRLSGVPGAPTDICIHEGRDKHALYAICSLSGEGVAGDCLVLHGLTPPLHRKRIQRFVNRGYRPVAISVAAAGDRPLLAASIWSPAPRDAAVEKATRSDTPTSLAADLPPPGAPPPDHGESAGAIPESEVRAGSLPPLPDPAARRQAIAAVRSVFADDLAAATSQGAMATLAAEMLDQASREPSEARRFALLDQARCLAISAVDPHLALCTMDELANRFKLECSWSWKAETLVMLSSAARTQLDRQAIAELAIGLAAQAAADEAFTAAEKLLVLARRSPDRSFRRQTGSLRSAIAQSERYCQAARVAAETLLHHPNDANARTKLGKYRCFFRGDWPAGLADLERGNDPELAALASRDLATPQAASDRLLVAEAWFAWAELADGPDQNGGWSRAQHWYTEALPGLDGLDESRAQKQLQLLADRIITHANGAHTRLVLLDAPVGQVVRFGGHDGPITHLVISSCGKWIITGSRDNTIRIWETSSGSERRVIVPRVKQITGLGLSRDGRLLIVAGRMKRVEFWRVVTGLRVPTAIGLDAPIVQMAVARHSGHLLWARPGNKPGNLQLIDLGRGVPIRRLTCPTPAAVIDLSPSGLIAVAGDRNHLVRAWNLAYDQPISLGQTTDAVLDVEVSPNERYIAACSMNQLMVWDVTTGREMHCLGGESFRRLAFDRNSHRLLTSARSNQLTVWDVRTGERIARMVAPAGEGSGLATYLASLPDPRGAVTSDNRGGVQIWRLPD